MSVRRSRRNRKKLQYKDLVPDAKPKTCQVRILNILESKLFAERHPVYFDWIKKGEVPSMEIMGEIFWRGRGKVNGFDFVIEIYKDAILRFVLKHFARTPQKLPKKAEMVVFAEKFAFVMLEELVHLIALNGPVLIDFKGVVFFD